jgi:hypothetical protein
VQHNATRAVQHSRTLVAAAPSSGNLLAWHSQPSCIMMHGIMVSRATAAAAGYIMVSRATAAAAGYIMVSRATAAAGYIMVSRATAASGYGTGPIQLNRCLQATLRCAGQQAGAAHALVIWRASWAVPAGQCQQGVIGTACTQVAAGTAVIAAAQLRPHRHPLNQGVASSGEATCRHHDRMDPWTHCHTTATQPAASYATLLSSTTLAVHPAMQCTPPPSQPSSYCTAHHHHHPSAQPRPKDLSCLAPGMWAPVTRCVSASSATLPPPVCTPCLCSAAAMVAAT